MGRSYANEVKEFSETYAWSLDCDISAVTEELARVRGIPSMSVGSGGSYTAAAMHAFLTRYYLGTVSTSLTPQDVMHLPTRLEEASIWLFSASGGNIDILNAAQALLSKEPAGLSILSMQTASRVGKLISEYPEGKAFEYTPPGKRDGYLATNSLLATCMILYRAFAEATNQRIAVPARLEEFLPIEPTDRQFDHIWNRPTIFVLHGPSTLPAALDFESKFTEAAIANVRIADFRNFAHGRHNWLNRFGDETAILSLVDDLDEKIATKTYRLIPDSIPKAEIRIPHAGGLAAVYGILSALTLTLPAGVAQGIDPGMPEIPSFGRKIYSLKYPIPKRPDVSRLPDRAKIALERKLKRPFPELESLDHANKYITAYNTYVDRLRRADIRALIFDYDGTLVSTKDRLKPPSRPLKRRLIEAVEHGILIGVATGRGSSVTEQLANLFPSQYHDQIFVGTHNAAELNTLSGDPIDEPLTDADGKLDDLKRWLTTSTISNDAVVSLKSSQLSVRHPNRQTLISLYGRIQNWLHSKNADKYHLAISGHSLDIIVPGASKLRLVDYFQSKRSLPAESILTIGDTGDWPGNDHELLDRFPSLSVGTTSMDLNSCWNISRRGSVGILGTQEILDSLLLPDGASRGVLKFHIKD